MRDVYIISVFVLRDVRTVKQVHTLLSPRWRLLCLEPLKCFVRDPLKERKYVMLFTIHTLNRSDGFCIQYVYNLDHIHKLLGVSVVTLLDFRRSAFDAARFMTSSWRRKKDERASELKWSVSQGTMLHSNLMHEGKYFWVSDAVL